MLDSIKNDKHKKFSNIKKNNRIPLSGGIFLYICTVIFIKDNSLLLFFSFLILLIGVLSDQNILIKPSARLYIQSFVIILFLFFEDLRVNNIKIDFVDKNFLSIKFLSLIFTAFCILVLINGTNFIDGLNTLAAGYFFSIFFMVIFISTKNNLYIDINMIKNFIFILLAFLLFNFFGKSYLGDGGAYFLAFFTSAILINFANKNEFISPYFIVLILWYPAFENFFSIIRKFFLKKSPYKPDVMHLHQLIYNFFLKRSLIPKVYLNTSVGVVINIYNFFTMYVGCLYYTKTNKIIFIILFNVFVYLIAYFFLYKVNKDYERYE
jgi:UDP-N-acetylmuramyl pentapeptide phosphotransferase/UDP-N-acetylglucosamine-1-phosphate transferase